MKAISTRFSPLLERLGWNHEMAVLGANRRPPDRSRVIDVTLVGRLRKVENQGHAIREDQVESLPRRGQAGVSSIGTVSESAYRTELMLAARSEARRPGNPFGRRGHGYNSRTHTLSEPPRGRQRRAQPPQRQSISAT